MAVCKDRDAKAELNHRGEVCEASLTPGFRVAEKLERRSPHRLDGGGMESDRAEPEFGAP
ncbi:MAG TPA: hypothetical protein PKA41_07835 [Verrucomicrobiota bacterium]|nr:hypothetical protein [Verrucomicrobiota bacterium]